MSEEYKSLAYSIKDMMQQENNVNTKILRILRNHEKRIQRLEKQQGITPSPYELDKANDILSETNTGERKIE